MSDTLTTDFYLKHEGMVRKQAGRQHKQSNLFSSEDIEQAIWLHFTEKWKWVKDSQPADLERYAYRAAAEWCRSQREDYMFFSGAIVYSGDMVERILAESVWVELEPGVDVEGRVDVGRAFGTLTFAQQRALFLRFGCKESLDNIDDKAVERGVRSITSWLNSRIQMERADLQEAANEV